VGSAAPTYNHSYLWVDDAWGFTMAIEGFPQQNTLGNWGLLVAQNSPNGLQGTNASANAEWGPELVSSASVLGPGSPSLASGNFTVDPNLCGQINSIFSYEMYYNAYPVSYMPVGGPNSNSLAHYFLTSAGLSGIFSEPPGTGGLGGWWTPIYP